MGIYSLCDVMVYTKDKTRNTELQAGLDNFRKHIPQRENKHRITKRKHIGKRQKQIILKTYSDWKKAHYFLHLD